MRQALTNISGRAKAMVNRRRLYGVIVHLNNERDKYIEKYLLERQREWVEN